MHFEGTIYKNVDYKSIFDDANRNRYPTVRKISRYPPGNDPFHSKIKNDPNECDKEAIKRIKAQIKYVNDTKTRYLN